MARRSRKVRYLSDIATHRELREARGRIEMRTWYAEQRLWDDVEYTLSAENLLSLVAPPGSLVERIVVGVDAGIATVRGVMGAIEYFRGKGR